MAIQHRRGSYSDFDPTKMTPAEVAVVTENDPIASDGKAVYVAFAPGVVKQLATHEELQGYDEDARIAAAAAADARDDAQTAYMNAYGSANASAGSAAASANSAAAAAGSADDAEATLEAAEAAIAAAQATAEEAISDAKDAAIEDINDAKDAAIADIGTAKTGAISDVDDTKDDAMDAINDRAAQIQEMTTNAEETAAAALQSATNAENDVAEFINTQGNLKNRVDAMELEMYGFPDDAYVEDGKAYFTHNGQVLFEVTGIGGGGGGGGGASTTLTVTNTTGWLTKTISSGKPCEVSLTWSSTLDGIATGDGTLNIYVNNVIRGSIAIEQGNITQEVGQYLQTGSNTVRVQVVDIDGNSRAINFQITCVALALSSTFDTDTVYQGAFSFPCTPVGAVEKTIYYYLDGTLLGTQVTSVSNRQVSYPIPAQTHGGHSIRVYFEATINEETVTSEELYFEFIYIDPLDSTPIIASSFNQATADQYSIVPIPFRVYTPGSLTSEVKVYDGEDLISTQTVDRTWQSFSYRANTVGETEITFKVGTEEKSVSFTVAESQIDVEAVTEDLVLYLTAEGRSNNEQNPAVWEYEDISATFSDFNWVSDGWQKDSDGATCLRVAGDARVTIPYKIFETDFRSGGKTIELEFATRNVLDYDADILTCYSGGRGIKLTAQSAKLDSEQSSISTQYKEDEHVRIAFVVEKQSENRLIHMYINGIDSRVVQYPVGDDFQQTSAVNISIGSDDCTIDVYNIRVYDNSLTRHQIVENWIADTQDGATMLDRYNRNNIFDAYGQIVTANLPANLPYMIISCPELPQSKGDVKEGVYGSFVNRLYPSKSFTFTGASFDVQGTSSQYYKRKNYKAKFKNGFVTASGSTISKYAMSANSIPVSTFCFKADVASSEGANNVELVSAYEQACLYKTPAQVENSKVRQGIEGFPMVIFWNNTTTGETTFLGKYNFNNDKSTENVFGFASPDESWEGLNNGGDHILWNTADYTTDAWLGDFEARYPDTKPAYTDSEQLATFAEWMVSTNRDLATNDPLSESVTYDGVTYTTDSSAYRLAKFKAEAGNYLELQSTLFYYIFTELFLMVDSRAKNTFLSFIGSEVVGS